LIDDHLNNEIKKVTRKIDYNDNEFLSKRLTINFQDKNFLENQKKFSIVINNHNVIKNKTLNCIKKKQMRSSLYLKNINLINF